MCEKCDEVKNDFIKVMEKFVEDDGRCSGDILIEYVDSVLADFYVKHFED